LIAVTSALLSIVVPTRDRPASLARCLEAIDAQDAGSLEVIVIDDGSHDRRAVAATVAEFARARLLHTAGIGPAGARNAGARAARGEVVCFTDDDCEPRPSWARLLAAAAGTGTAAGSTVAPEDAAGVVRASQAITNRLQLASLDPVTARLGFAPTCNLACSRAAIIALPFDESYPDAAGEDRDWSARAAAGGLAPTYVQDAIVVHRQRLDAAGFWRQQLRYGRGASRFRSGAPGRGLASAGFYAGLVRAGFHEGPAVGALVLAAQAVTAAGVAAERLSRLARS
jgi:glycosyltransferase involved in cell wall biosynthesis